MGRFLDWIKDRDGQKVAPAVPEFRPGQVKQAHAQRDAEELAARKPVTAEVAEQARNAAAAVKLWSGMPQNSPAGIPEGGGNPTAQLQKGQETTQTPLSPTDAAAGQTELQEKPRSPEEKVDRPQTIKRPTPSWER